MKQLVGVTSVRTEEDYAQARATIDTLLDEVGDDENHPLVDVLDYLADQVKAYEDENFQIPQAPPRKRSLEMLPGYGFDSFMRIKCA